LEEGDEEDEEAHLGLAALPGLEGAKGAQGVPGLGPNGAPAEHQRKRDRDAAHAEDVPRLSRPNGRPCVVAGVTDEGGGEAVHDLADEDDGARRVGRNAEHLLAVNHGVEEPDGSGEVVQHVAEAVGDDQTRRHA